jgi:hypothetical protein
MGRVWLSAMDQELVLHVEQFETVTSRLPTLAPI